MTSAFSRQNSSSLCPTPYLLHGRYKLNHWKASLLEKNIAKRALLSSEHTSDTDFQKFPCKTPWTLGVRCYLYYQDIIKKKKNNYSIIPQQMVKAQSVQLLKHAQLCNPMNRSMPGFPIHPTPRSCTNSCPSSWWCQQTI